MESTEDTPATPLPLPGAAPQLPHPERTRKVTLEATVRRTREPSDSITRRVVREEDGIPDWSPADELAFDAPAPRSTAAAPGSEQTDEKLALPDYQELIASTRDDETSVEVELQVGDPEDQVDLVQTPPWARRRLQAAEALLKRPLPSLAPLPALEIESFPAAPQEPPTRREPLRRERSSGGGGRPCLTDFISSPSGVRRPAPVVPPGIWQSIEQEIVGLEDQPGPSAAPASSAPMSCSASTEIPLPLHPAARSQLGAGAGRAAAGPRLLPVVGGSAAAVLAGGLVVLLLTSGNHPAPAPAPAPALVRASRPRPALSRSPEQLVAAASRLEQNGEHRKAHRLYLEALARSPGLPSGLLGEARTAVELSLPGALQRLRRSGPGQQRAIALLQIRQAMLAGQWVEAEAGLEALRGPSPDPARAELWRAEILSARGRTEDAAASYRWLLREGGLPAGALQAEAALGYSRLLLDLGKREEALRYAERALRSAAGRPGLEEQARALLDRFGSD